MGNKYYRITQIGLEEYSIKIVHNYHIYNLEHLKLFDLLELLDFLFDLQFEDKSKSHAYEKF